MTLKRGCYSFRLYSLSDFTTKSPSQKKPNPNMQWTINTETLLNIDIAEINCFTERKQCLH